MSLTSYVAPIHLRFHSAKTEDANALYQKAAQLIIDFFASEGMTITEANVKGPIIEGWVVIPDSPLDRKQVKYFFGGVLRKLSELKELGCIACPGIAIKGGELHEKMQRDDILAILHSSVEEDIIKNQMIRELSEKLGIELPPCNCPSCRAEREQQQGQGDEHQ